MGKKELPRCIYCKRKLTYTWPAHMRDSDPDLWPPTRGRCGLGRYCSLVCLEQETIQRHTGRSKPRGDSHPWAKRPDGTYARNNKEGE